MKCVVPSQNVKVLAKAFHSLGRIGEDLFIEPHRTHLAFRTVNLAESAYASFTFSKSFFSSYSFDEGDDEETLRSKISMKSLVVILKAQHGEKLIEWCQISLTSNGTKVIFQLRYSHGCTKTHFLPILESETLQANYSKEDSQGQLSALPKLLSTAVKNFRTNEDEITLCVSPEKIILRNHLENNLESKKAVRTEISLYPAEFESYKASAASSVTFCLKELRAVLLFAEFTALPVEFYITSAGKPVVFVVKNDTVYEANYVVSTLSESGSSQSLSQQSESSTTTSSRVHGPQPPATSSGKKRPYEEVAVSEHPTTPQLRHSLPTTSVQANYSQMTRTRPLNASANLSFSSQCHLSETMEVTRDKAVNQTQPVVKDVFGRCFNTTFKKQSVQGYSKVLAYDSDGMEDSD